MSLDLAIEQVSVLDKGYVALMDVMGNDQRIVDAARVSYGTQKARRTDAALIEYLLENGHTSPFEMVETLWIVKMPIFVARQWVRHRTASINEISGRYTKLPEEAYMPEEDDLMLQDKVNRQGRGTNAVNEPWEHLRLMDDQQREAFKTYNLHLDSGLANELSRINLPLSTYTQWYWKMDLHNLFHFLRLRMDPHAQKEIRVYAEAMYSMLKPKLPLAFAAFDAHVLNAVKFSSHEMKWLIRSLSIDLSRKGALYEFYAEVRNDPNMQSNEDRRIKHFFHKLGLPIPKDA